MAFIHASQKRSSRDLSASSDIWLQVCAHSGWVFPKIGVPQKGWFTIDNPIKMDDLGVPLFSETSISTHIIT